MKKLFAILAVAGVMAACNNGKTDTATADSLRVADSTKTADSLKAAAADTTKKADTTKVIVDTTKKM